MSFSKLRFVFNCFALTVIFSVFSISPAIAATRQTPLIINHNQVSEFDSLTPDQISSASALRLLVRVASVGGRIGHSLLVPDGTYTGLEQLKIDFPLMNLNRDNWFFEPRGNPGWQLKLTDINNQVAGRYNSFDIFSMKFCYIDYMA